MYICIFIINILLAIFFNATCSQSRSALRIVPRGLPVVFAFFLVVLFIVKLQVVIVVVAEGIIQFFVIHHTNLHSHVSLPQEPIAIGISKLFIKLL